MKLSELTFAMALRRGARDFSMHFDATDVMRQIINPEQLEEVKAKLIRRWGDMDITVNPEAEWNHVVEFHDEAWKEAYQNYCNAAQTWCDTYGCD